MLFLPTGDSWCLLDDCRISFAVQTTVSSSPELCFDSFPSHMWFPTAHCQADISSHCSGGWLPWCLETPTSVMTEPCQCDWQICTHSGLGHPRSTDDSSKTCEDKRASGFGRLRSKQNRPWLQPMSFGEAVRPVQSLNLVHGVTEMHEGEAKKDEQINRHEISGTLDKGEDTREQEEEKKHKTKRRNIISPSSNILAMSLALPSYPAPSKERNYICVSTCYH